VIPKLIASHYSLAGSAPPAPASVPFNERVVAAAAAGFAGVGLVARDYRALIEGGSTNDDLLNVLRQNGIRVEEVELMRGWVDECDEALENSVRNQESIYRMAAVFSPHHIIAGDPKVGDVPSDYRPIAERFGEICDRVAPYGSKVGIEFIPGTRIPDAQTAWKIAEEAGRPNGGLLVDLLHHFRGGGTIEDLLEIPATGFAGIQVSDHGPMTNLAHFDEWRFGGLLPGEGVFELERLFRVLDEHGVDVPYSIEVLSPSLNRLGATEAAYRMAKSTLDILTTGHA